MLYRLPVSMVLLVVLLCSPLTLHAQVEESEQLAQARARIAELEKEIRVLQAKLTLLETQMKNQAAAGAAEATPAATSGPTSPVSAASALPSVPERAAPIRKFPSLLQPMQLLPPKLRPTMGKGWDSFKNDEAKLWFKETFTGDDQFDGRVLVRVSRIAPMQTTVNGVRVQRYPVMLRFIAPSFTYIGIPFEPHDFRETIYVDAETAKRYEKLDPEIPLRVTGSLVKYSAEMKYRSDKEGAVRWELKDWKIHSPHLPD